MLAQYLKIKEQYSDSILLFRLGDFYEMFFEDAKIAASILDITLTSRNKNDKNSVPLCGIPYHSVEPYIVKLLENGKKVAICDQLEDPKKAKGIVKRDVTRVLTPGVVPDGLGLKGDRNNYLMGLVAPLENNSIGMAVADASTGHFLAAELKSEVELIEELTRLEPSEIIFSGQFKDYNRFSEKISRYAPKALFTMLPARNDNGSIARLEGGSHLIDETALGAMAASAVLEYIETTQKGNLGQINSVGLYSAGRFMKLDESTVKNLELIRTTDGRDVDGTLFSALCRTKTAAGARKLKRWILYPLTDIGEINKRLSAVADILSSPNLGRELPSVLAQIYDIERILGRINSKTANARDLISLSASLTAIKRARASITGVSGLLAEIHEEMDPCDDLADEISAKIADDPPISLRDGGMIKKGVDSDLDELRDIIAGGKDQILWVEQQEKKRTGISSLKVKYNRVFGYYIEITNTHRDKVPQNYLRKQTLANAERYITPELKEYEEKVLGAEEKVRLLEYEIFSALRENTAMRTRELQKTADAVASLDVLCSHATIAAEFNYQKPLVDAGSAISIKDGRHPVVERLNPLERFVPNDIEVDVDSKKFLMITGPNMAGKSTVMRQAALIVLMAQAGSFVPAREARIGVTDRIFTRVGASDMLSRGQSTFMVEMSEAALILKNATPRSLVIIDEIGRGTSTFDGLSIAWAVAEDLHDRVGARTLFATHYHELTDLASVKEGICNMQIAVRECGGEVVFLRKLISGATSRSYGIEVGRLAGLPPKVIERAREILANLEAGELDEIGMPRIAKHARGDGANPRPEEEARFFCKSISDEVYEKISALDTSTITPLEALNLLHELKQKIRQ